MLFITNLLISWDLSSGVSALAGWAWWRQSSRLRNTNLDNRTNGLLRSSGCRIDLGLCCKWKLLLYSHYSLFRSLDLLSFEWIFTSELYHCSLTCKQLSIRLFLVSALVSLLSWELSDASWKRTCLNGTCLDGESWSVVIIASICEHVLWEVLEWTISWVLSLSPSLQGLTAWDNPKDPLMSMIKQMVNLLQVGQ